MRVRPRGWPWLAVMLAGVLTLSAHGASPRPPIEVENFRVGFSNNSQSNLFKTGAWTPVWIQLRAGDQRFSGFLELTVPDDDGTPTLVRQIIDLAPGDSQRFTTYARPGSNEPDFGIRLIDPSRRIRTPRIEGTSLAKFNTLDALRSDDTLLLTLGQPQGVELVPTLPGFAPDQASPGHGIVVARIDVTGGYMPGRWYGYDAARAIVVDTNDREAISALEGLRGRALAEWVRRGGHIVIGVGANWQQVRDSELGAILPASLTGQERINDLGAIESFVGGSTKPIAPAGSPPVMVAKLENVQERGGKVLSVSAGVPLVVRGSHGFGRVTVVALDVDQRPFAKWEDRALFWVRALDLRRQGSDNSGQPRARVGGRFVQSGVHDLSGKLKEALEQFKGVKLVSFGWVAFFIFLYILLIGPGDYLFLKKVLKRMELTWVTFPLIVITVSMLAYYAAYVIKGNDLRINKVDVIDVLQAPGPENAVPPGGLMRGTTYLDVFSPQNRDYTMSIVPLPLDRDLPASEPAPPRPPAGTDVFVTWFSSPDPALGAGNGAHLGFASGGYEYLPIGGAEKLEGVRVPIWSTKCLTGRWFGPGPATPLLETDVMPAGPDRLQGTIANRSGTTLYDPIVAFNKHVYVIRKPIAPGETIRVELSHEDRQLSGYLQFNGQNFLPANQFNNPQQTIDRAELMLNLMFHDSSTKTASDSTLASNALYDLDLTGLLALERPMLIARIDRPTSRLVLDNAPSAPKIEQTTLLRVIFPLKKEGDDDKAAK